ncbi:hypothetical protein Y1Q_0022372 [Alligator mississippiensis]|uniref:Uncharacterized protein n=1 Tax=Alligator mississippiensis TaxID=8496 RepID=A0A151P112_ALLMI|nr:hypothetical protein Y1Q_0022372 [Alligator mississippiensis]
MPPQLPWLEYWGESGQAYELFLIQSYVTFHNAIGLRMVRRDKLGLFSSSVPGSVLCHFVVSIDLVLFQPPDVPSVRGAKLKGGYLLRYQRGIAVIC